MIMLFPWSAKTTDGKPNPKNYPHFDAVVERLSGQGFNVYQVSRSGEPDIKGCSHRFNDIKLASIVELMKTCETWVSGDSFAQHLAWVSGEPGVVVFGSSDPLIFGHPENINLLKDRCFLRARQFGLWSQEKAYPEMFVGPEVVVSAVRLSIANRNLRKEKALK